MWTEGWACTKIQDSVWGSRMRTCCSEANAAKLLGAPTEFTSGPWRGTDHLVRSSQSCCLNGSTCLDLRGHLCSLSMWRQHMPIFCQAHLLRIQKRGGDAKALQVGIWVLRLFLPVLHGLRQPLMVCDTSLALKQQGKKVPRKIINGKYLWIHGVQTVPSKPASSTSRVRETTSPGRSGVAWVVL